MRHLIQCCVFLLLAITPLRAQTSELGDAQNFSKAEVVLIGEVLTAETSLEFGRSVTDYRVAVEGVVKGELSYSPVVIRAYGDENLHLEERVFIFLGSQQNDGAFHILQVNHLGEEGQKVDRAAESPDKMCGTVANGTALDATGDAVANSLISPSPDLVAASASSNGTNVAFTVLYDPSTFDPATTRFRFYIDIDENPATGFPGVLGNDSNLFGTEFIIATDGDGTQIRKHDPTSPPGGSQFDIIGSASVTVLPDGFRTAIPLSLLDDDNVFAFKVFADVHVGSTFTSETDYVPNLGLAPGRTRPTGNAVAAPSNLRADAVSQVQVDLDWNDNSNNEEQFEVERRTGSSGAFQRIAVVAQNVSFFRDQTVSPETSYSYRVRAVSDGCPSNYTAIVNTTTPSAGERRPVDLAVEALSSSEIQLNWTDRAASEDGYEVQVRAEGGDFVVAQALPAESQNTTVDGLMEGTTYTFRVRATGGLGNSPFSNQATAKTFFANPEPCVPGPNTLCLQEGRFKVEIDWRDFEDNQGTASDAGLTSPDSGLLYFFTPANWEMLVKVIDGCGFNGHFWVFAAATTNVEYTLTVTDSVSGFIEMYHNDLGVSSPAIADINAFATCGGDGLSTAEAAVSEAPAVGPEALPTVTSSRVVGIPKVGTGCVPSDTNLCLNDERFHVEIEWEDFEGNTGVGHVDPLQSADSGLFWFFDEDNVEVLVKVINGCGFNGHHWVFAAATTNVEYTLRVIETESSDVQEYSNPLGNAAAATTDVKAFANCP